MLTLNDGRKQLYQWDIGRKATVDIDCDIIHFANLDYGEALAVEVKSGEVEIPNQLLLSGEKLICWAFVKDLDGSYTKQKQIFEVLKRAKPSDYVYTQTEVISINQVVDDAIKKAVASGVFKGEKGDPGINGMSAYKSAQMGGYSGTETQFYDDLAAVGTVGNPGTTFIPSVNDGVLSWTNDGGLENPPPVDIVAEVIEDLPKYSGSYTVTPLVRESKLDTQSKVMTDDIHVEAIPYHEVSNNSGGETAVIGQP